MQKYINGFQTERAKIENWYNISSSTLNFLCLLLFYVQKDLSLRWCKKTASKKSSIERRMIKTQRATTFSSLSQIDKNSFLKSTKAIKTFFHTKYFLLRFRWRYVRVTSNFIFNLALIELSRLIRKLTLQVLHPSFSHTRRHTRSPMLWSHETFFSLCNF